MLAMKTKRIIRETVFYIILSAIILVMMFPIYWLVVTSLQPSGVIFASTPTFTPVENLFVSYGRYLQTGPFPLWLQNTLKIAAVVVAASLLLAIPAGYSISRFSFKGKSAALFGILLTQMLPLVFILIPVYYVFTNIGLGNTHEALMIINVAVVLPVSIWFLKGFFDGVPKELEEAAAIDGASRPARC
jgi:multiple sugar transport system permease protein